MTTNNTRAQSLAAAKTRTVAAVDALSAHLVKLRSDVEAVQTVESAEAVCASVKQALSLHTTMSMAARYVRQTVQRPGKTAAEAQIRRGDPAGVVAELFVITAHWQDKSTKMHVPAHSPLAMDAIRLCWPAIRRKYNLPADATIPEGCAAALRKAWDAHTAKHGHSGSCYVADAYAGTRGLRAALHR